MMTPVLVTELLMIRSAAARAPSHRRTRGG
jgi:hypothetical protein